MSAQLRLDLLSLSDRDLLLHAGEATHQHFKGGLYRLLGPLKDADTGTWMHSGSFGDNEPPLVYEHLFPHSRELWLRDAHEFVGLVDCPEWHPMYRVGLQIRRFRPIGCEWEMK